MKKTKNRISILLVIALVAMMGITAVLAPMNRVNAEEEEEATYVKYFVVEKKWVDADNSNRPSSVTIHIAGSDGKTYTSTLKASEGWKKEFKEYPAYDDDNKEITYTVYEDSITGYVGSNPQTNPLTLKDTVIKLSEDRDEISHGEFSVSQEGFAAVPEGDIVIDERLLLEDLKEENISLPTGFSKGTYTVYGDPADRNNDTNTGPRIVYDGTYSAGKNQISGNIVLKWEDKATNIYSGENYDVRITISNISIFALKEMSKKVAILANQAGGLHMQAYVSEFTSYNENIVGVEANIKIEILKKDGKPVDGYIQVYITDLDVRDKTVTNNNSAYGIAYSYSESAEPLTGVVSDIYVSGANTVLEYNTENPTRFAAKIATSWNSDPRTAIEYLAKAGAYSYKWTGSNCGTVIIVKGTANVPDPKDITNTITNTKVYTVTYHDNKPEPLFENQVNPGLIYDQPTPGFDTDLEKEGIQAGDPVKQGYNFLGWTTEQDGTDYMTSAEVIAINVTEDADYWAHWAPRDDTKYTVEYYYQEHYFDETDGIYKVRYLETPNGSDSRKGVTAETAYVTTVEGGDTTPKPEAYGLDAVYVLDDDWKDKIYSDTIAPDGSTVLKVYFKQQFTVTYNDGEANGTAFEDDVHPGNDYGKTTPDFSGTPTWKGHKFVGWLPVIEDTVTHNITYVAQWRKIAANYALPVTGVDRVPGK